MSKSSQLVCQQLENISSVVLEEFQDIVKRYIRGRNGVYALYKGEKLYYVGLATNLRSRLKQHLRDRHSGLWDRFSVYLTIGDSHLKEMESLLLRIAHPTGNKQIGRFVKCENLVKRLARDIQTRQRDQTTGMLGLKRRAIVGRDPTDDRPILAPYVSYIRRSRLRARYKGKWYRARVRRDGSITVRGPGGRNFNSPSLAATHVVKRSMNGWWFWHYERSPGEWIRLKHLRD